MSNEITIKTGELVINKGAYVLKTGSIGSCVVIAIYDRTLKAGGLAHAMLPTRRNSEGASSEPVDFNPGNTSAKYADEAVSNLVSGLKKHGVKIENMEAKLIGGASMFRKLTGDKKGIGFQNVESARNALKKIGIEVSNEDTGGNSGKSVDFDLHTGLVDVVTTL